MKSQFNEHLAAVGRKLMKAHIVVPHSYHGGFVYFEHKEADLYRMSVPAGGTKFEFHFSFDKQGRAFSIPAAR